MTKLLKNAGIYVLRKCDNGKCYVGKDFRLGKRARRHLTLNTPDCPAIHNAIKKHGADAFEVELIPYPNISHEALKAVEQWKIRQLKSHRSQGGYNLTWGGDGIDPETLREMFADGTHPFLDGEIQRKTQRKRVADGTHNFLDSEIQRETQRKRLADGTHNFLDSDFQREVSRESNRKRVADGTHHLLGGEIQRKRVADGTHNLLGGEITRKQFADGTHPFLNKSVSRRGHYVHRIKRKAQRRELYRIYATILTAKSVCEERIYRKRIREGFFDVEIPDTSNAEQQEVSFD